MKLCKKCGKEFKIHVKINGENKNLNSRKFCLECSPFGLHNTKNFCNITCPDKKLKKRNTTNNKNKHKRREIKKHLITLHGGKCKKCGYNENFLGTYDFHHQDPSKKRFTISSKSNLLQVIEESKKCMLVCNRCHREIHHFIKINLFPDNNQLVDDFTVNKGVVGSSPARGANFPVSNAGAVAKECKLNKGQIKSKEWRMRRKLAVVQARQRRKIELIEHKGGKCQQCGYSKNIPDAYCFHHRDPSIKLFGLGDGNCRSKDADFLEVEKCELLCVRCHMEIHEKFFTHDND